MLLFLLSAGDKYYETEDDITWVKDGSVKIRYEKTGLASAPSITVMSMFKSTCAKFGNHKALGE